MSEVLALRPFESIAAIWIALSSGWTFLLFGFDKWRATRAGARRLSEAVLCWSSALGGWPGGMLGMVLFRHKSAKQSFQAKFALAFGAWAALVTGVLKLAGRF